MKGSIAVAVLFFCAGALSAAEHPKEHPTQPAAAPTQTSAAEHPAAPAPAKEHPKGHEHPVGSKPWVKQMDKEYTAAVKDFVKQADKAGGFKVHDDKLNKEWALKLKRIHEDRIQYLGHDTFFACADFNSAAKGDKSKLDLDFYAMKGADGWKMDKILVHKVDGQARYTYNEKNEMVPAAQ